MPRFVALLMLCVAAFAADHRRAMKSVRAL